MTGLPTSPRRRVAASTAALADLVRQEVRRAYPGATVSVASGGRYARLEDFGRRYQEARSALDIVQSLHQQDRTVALDDLGIYGILFRREDQDELLRFADRLLGSLVEYDRRHRTALLPTLEVYLDENGAFRNTARRLFIHLNTLRGRLQRITQLCQRDLHDAKTRLNLQLALEIYRLTQRNGRKPE